MPRLTRHESSTALLDGPEPDDQAEAVEQEHQAEPQAPDWWGGAYRNTTIGKMDDARVAESIRRQVARDPSEVDRLAAKCRRTEAEFLASPWESKAQEAIEARKRFRVGALAVGRDADRECPPPKKSPGQLVYARALSDGPHGLKGLREARQKIAHNADPRIEFIQRAQGTPTDSTSTLFRQREIEHTTNARNLDIARAADLAAELLGQDDGSGDAAAWDAMVRSATASRARMVATAFDDAGGPEKIAEGIYRAKLTTGKDSEGTAAAPMLATIKARLDKAAAEREQAEGPTSTLPTWIIDQHRTAEAEASEELEGARKRVEGQRRSAAASLVGRALSGDDDARREILTLTAAAPGEFPAGFADALRSADAPPAAYSGPAPLWIEAACCGAFAALG